MLSSRRLRRDVEPGAIPILLLRLLYVRRLLVEKALHRHRQEENPVRARETARYVKVQKGGNISTHRINLGISSNVNQIEFSDLLFGNDHFPSQKTTPFGPLTHFLFFRTKTNDPPHHYLQFSEERLNLHRIEQQNRHVLDI